MQTISQTVTGGTPWKLSVQGSYFRILDIGVSVTVYFFKQGRIVGNADSVAEGFWFDAGQFDAFDSVEIHSDVTQFIKIAIVQGGRAGYDVVVISNMGEASGEMSADYYDSVRATLALMYPTMTATAGGELDVAMLFLGTGYSSKQQAIFALTADAEASAANLRGTLSQTNFPIGA